MCQIHACLQMPIMLSGSFYLSVAFFEEILHVGLFHAIIWTQFVVKHLSHLQFAKKFYQQLESDLLVLVFLGLPGFFVLVNLPVSLHSFRIWLTKLS